MSVSSSKQKEALRVATALTLVVVVVAALTYGVITAPTAGAYARVKVVRAWYVDVGSGVPYSIDVTPDGSLAVIATDYPPRLILVSTDSGEIMGEVKNVCSECLLSSATISPDGSRVAVIAARSTGGDNYVFKVVTVSLKTRKVVWASKEFPSFGWTLRYSPDGKLIVVTSGDGDKVYALRSDTGALVWTVSISGAEKVLGVATSSGGVYVTYLTTDGDGGVMLISYGGKEVRKVTGLEGTPLIPSLTLDGKLLTIPLGISKGGDTYAGKVVALNPSTLKRLYESPELSDYVWATTPIHEAGANVVAGIIDNGTVCFFTQWDLKPITCARNKGWAGDDLAALPNKPVVLITIDKKQSSGDYVGRVVAYKVWAEGTGTAPHTTTQPSTTQPSTTQPTTPATTPATTTQPTTPQTTQQQTTPPTTTKPSTTQPPWLLIGAGAAGAVVVLIVIVAVITRRRRAGYYGGAYAPPPPPPP